MSHETELKAALRAIEENLALPEPGFFTDTFETLTGPRGWVPGIMLLAQAGLFLAGLYAAWVCYQTTDPLTAIKTGLLASVLVLTAAIIKMGVIPMLETRRILRALRVLESALNTSRG